MDEPGKNEAATSCGLRETRSLMSDAAVKARWVSRGLPLYVLPVAVYEASQGITTPSPHLNVALAVLLLVIYPGWLVSRLLSARGVTGSVAGGLAALALYFTLGFGALAPVLQLLLLLHAPTESVGPVLAIVILALGGATALIEMRRERRGGRLPRRARWRGWAEVVPLGILLGVTAGALAIQLHYATVASSLTDGWGQLAFIQRFLSGAQLDAADPIFQTGEVQARFRFPVFYIFEALVTRVSDEPAPDVYFLFLPPIVLVLGIAATYFLAETVLRNRLYAALAVAVQFAYLLSIGFLGAQQGSLGSGIFRRASEDKFVMALVVLPVTLALVVRYLRRPGYLNLSLLAIALIGLTLLHPMGYPLAAIPLAMMSALHVAAAPTMRRLREVLPLVAPLALFIVVPLVQLTESGGFRVWLTTAELGLTPDELGLHRVLPVVFDGRLVMLDPRQLLTPILLGGMAVTLLALRSWRTDVGARILLATMLITPAIVLLPVTASPIAWTSSQTFLWRVIWLLPVGVAWAWALKSSLSLVEWIPAHRWRRMAPWAVVAAGLLLTIGLSGSLYAAAFSDLDEFKNDALPVTEREVLERMDQLLTEDSVVIAPPAVTRHLPGFSDKAYVTSFGFGSGGLPESREALDQFYGDGDALEPRLQVMRDFGAQWAIAQKGSPTHLVLLRAPGAFRLEYENSAYVVFRYTQ